MHNYIMKTQREKEVEAGLGLGREDRSYYWVTSLNPKA